MKFNAAILATLATLVSVQSGWAYSHNRLLESQSLRCTVNVNGKKDTFPLTRSRFQNRDTGALSGSLEATFLYGDFYATEGSHVLADLVEAKLGTNSWAITSELVAAKTPQALGGEFAYQSWSNGSHDKPDVALELNLTPQAQTGSYRYNLTLNFAQVAPSEVISFTGICNSAE